MDKQKQRIPSFFKVLLDDSANYLQLPSAFVNSNFLEREFPANPVLKTESGGKWRVKIEIIGGKFYFGKGWTEFVKDTKTEAGDFLVFRLIRNSNFQVSIFAPNFCEKDLSRLVAPTTRTNASSCSKCGKKIAHMKSVIKIEEEEEEEEEEDEGEDEGNPRIQKILKKYNIYFMCLAVNFVSESELERSGRRSRKTIMLRNQEGKEWEVKMVRSKNGRISLTSGWSAFRKDNRLIEGDTCSFQYFHGQTSFINFELLHKVPRKRGRPPLCEIPVKRGK